MSTHTNRLAKEKSPYLLQHQHNPVDWYPWGPEAFEKAKTEDKPIFLSVGYSTCHWCHVMERESFESENIAEILNKNFVPIKVDREERPDVDRIYMTYLQATSGGGGWPMSVWLTPSLKPFFAGTYFPPGSNYGRPGFADLLLRIKSMWKDHRQELLTSAEDATESLRDTVVPKHGEKSDDLFSADLPQKVFATYHALIAKGYDSKLGGFTKAPKFPRPVVFTALYHHYYRERQPATLAMIEFTLQQMFKGGMHDHLGGGFHRYSVDKYWHVPHFEKMLYDQAQLVYSYLTAYQITKKNLYADAAKDVLEYVSTKLLAPEGGFYSAEDADSYISHDSKKKAEGAFYVWDKAEIDSLLGDDSQIFCYHYGVKEHGNTEPESDPHHEFVNKNVLIERYSISETAAKFGLYAPQVTDLLAKCRQILYQVREKRPHPFLDDKIITAWNGLMIAAFAQAYQVLRLEKYLTIAERATNFIKTVLYTADGQLIRNYREGPSQVKAFADDYAFMISALLDLYEAGGNHEWLKWAIQLQDKMDHLFADSEHGGYFSVAAGDESLVLRPKEEYDGAEPSPNSFAVTNLVRLYYITQKEDHLNKAKKILSLYRRELTEAPIILPHMVAGLDMFCSKPKQIVIAGKLNEEDTRNYQKTVFSSFVPNKLVVYADEGEGQKLLVEIGADYVKPDSMKVNNKVAAMVCHNFTCNIATDVDKLQDLLNQR